MRAKDGTVRQDVRPYGHGSGASRGDRGRRGSPPGASTAEEGLDAANGEKSERVRRGILDATLACFAEHGWSGTNMSVIARRSRMTRGRIQYYFPTLDDLLRASIDHLMLEWRRKYFDLVAQVADTSARFETGIDVLWGLMQDPLHVAKQELEASARTNPELRTLMQQAAAVDEEASVRAAELAYPELARSGEGALRIARNFTMVFMEGLALYRFSEDAEARRAELLEMLKAVLASYWSAHGVDSLREHAPADRPPNPAVAPHLRERDRERALALIQEAAALLSTDKNNVRPPA